MMGLGLALFDVVARLAALENGGRPPLPAGWSFITLSGRFLLVEGAYLIERSH